MRSPTVPPLDCTHAMTCLPCYWHGGHAAHINVPVYKGMHLSELKRALHAELNQGSVGGSDPRTHDDSGDVGDAWYRRAHAAVNLLKPRKPRQRRLFNDLEPSSEGDDEVHAYFVFVDREPKP